MANGCGRTEASVSKILHFGHVGLKDHYTSMILIHIAGGWIIWLS